MSCMKDVLQDATVWIAGPLRLGFTSKTAASRAVTKALGAWIWLLSKPHGGADQRDQPQARIQHPVLT